MKLLAPAEFRKPQSTSDFAIQQSRDSSANMLQRQAAILPDAEGTVQSRDSARLRFHQNVTRYSEWSF